jgi:hypothetical protein
MIWASWEWTLSSDVHGLSPWDYLCYDSDFEFVYASEMKQRERASQIFEKQTSEGYWQTEISREDFTPISMLRLLTIEPNENETELGFTSEQMDIYTTVVILHFIDVKLSVVKSHFADQF